MIRKRRLFCLPDETCIFEVSGLATRRHHVEFVEGGHGYVYRWPSKKEILVEKMLSRSDQCANTIHEIDEQQSMKHRGWTYERAHEHANQVEQRVRRSGSPCRFLARLVRMVG